MPRIGTIGQNIISEDIIIAGNNSINVDNNDGSDSLVINLKKNTDSAYRMSISMYGVIQFGPGNAAQDALIRRIGANMLETPDKWICASLGVDNSAAGNTLGNLVKQFELFDGDGNSIGYVPIYDAITQV